MNKSILLTGPKASGKTTKLKEIISSLDPSKVKEIAFKNLQTFINSPESQHVDIIALEEIYSNEQFDTIIKLEKQTNFKFIITTQSNVKELFETIESFEIIKCNDRF